MVDEKYDIMPGPWGIGPSKKGGTEINFGIVDLLDRSRDKPVLILPNGEKITIPQGINNININQINDIYPRPKASETVVEKNMVGNPFVSESGNETFDKLIKSLPPDYKLTELLVKGEVIDNDSRWKVLTDETGNYIKLGKYYLYEEIKNQE